MPLTFIAAYITLTARLRPVRISAANSLLRTFMPHPRFTRRTVLSGAATGAIATAASSLVQPMHVISRY
ncbi:MAG: hypothetical protein WBA57_05370 [Elainellaceae cyanobacterium]